MLEVHLEGILNGQRTVTMDHKLEKGRRVLPIGELQTLHLEAEETQGIGDYEGGLGK